MKECAMSSQCGEIFYQVIYKNVKHMTIRVTAKAEVIVTAPQYYREEQIRKFVTEKSSWIVKHLMEMKQRQGITLSELAFGEEEERELRALVDAYLPAFARYQIPEPRVHFRRMKSRWGSCNKSRASITLNQALCAVPPECRTYVVVHELAHLVEANHSAAFYQVVETVLPKYKEYEKKLKDYALQDEK